MSSLFVVLFCFFQVFLNISNACLIPERKIVFGVKMFSKSNIGWVYWMLFKLFENCLDFSELFYV